jgi:hypothetical protein
MRIVHAERCKPLKVQTETGRPIEKNACFQNTGNCFICRICEKNIPLDLIEEHPALCFKAHQNEYQNFCTTQHLIEKNQNLIKQFFIDKFPACDAPQHFFPARCLHLLSNVVIHVSFMCHSCVIHVSFMCHSCEFN